MSRRFYRLVGYALVAPLGAILIVTAPAKIGLYIASLPFGWLEDFAMRQLHQIAGRK